MLSFARQLSKRFSLRDYIYWRLEGGKSVYEWEGRKNWKRETEGLEHCCVRLHRSPITKALNSTMHPSKRTIASSLSLSLCK